MKEEEVEGAREARSFAEILASIDTTLAALLELYSDEPEDDPE